MFDRFKSLSVRQQVGLVALAVGAFCVVLVSLWFVFLHVPYRVLFAQLRPSDAAAITADLDRKKVPYRLADGGATILVPADIADRTRLGVMSGDVPLKGTVGFELFDRSDMGLTDFAQKINYQRALQGELERTISSLDGVDVARVHLSLGEQRIFRDDQVPPKASVTVRMQRGLTLSASAALGIARLIAAAVPSLDAANVVILDEKGRVVGTGPSSQTDIAALLPADEERRAVENYYQARARDAVTRAYPLASETVLVVAGNPQSPTSLADWTPATRSFSLMATITAPPALDAATRDAMRETVAAAIGYDLAKNDVVEFRADAGGEIKSAAASPERARQLEAAVLPTTDPLIPVVTIVLFLALLAIAGAFLWQLRRPKRLSDTQKAELAKKFRTLLDAGDSHAVS